jgi:hypothetical protein
LGGRILASNGSRTSVPSRLTHHSHFNSSHAWDFVPDTPLVADMQVYQVLVRVQESASPAAGHHPATATTRSHTEAFCVRPRAVRKRPCGVCFIRSRVQQPPTLVRIPHKLSNPTLHHQVHSFAGATSTCSHTAFRLNLQARGLSHFRILSFVFFLTPCTLNSNRYFRYIFRIKDLDLGKLGMGFGLHDLPRMPELRDPKNSINFVASEVDTGAPQFRVSNPTKHVRGNFEWRKDACI